MARIYGGSTNAYLQKGEFDNAISNYTEAINRDPSYADAYIIRGLVWLHQRKWEEAKSDLMTARNMGMDVIAKFHDIYASIEDFKQKTGIQLPPDIASLLTS